MSWEPSSTSSQTSNRWRPPSPVPSSSTNPLMGLKRETWKPTSSWTPAGRDADLPWAGETSGRPPAPSSASQAGPSFQDRPFKPPTSPRARDPPPPPPPPPPENSTFEERREWRRLHADAYAQVNARVGRGDRREPVGEHRSWEAWNSKVKQTDERRRDPNRPEETRGGPSRPDIRVAERRRELEDEASGRSWSAWKSKVEGTAGELSNRADDGPNGRDRDQGWGARRRTDEEPRRPDPMPGRRPPEADRSWVTYQGQRDNRLKAGERNGSGPLPPRRPTPPTRPRALSRGSSPSSTSGHRSPLPADEHGRNILPRSRAGSPPRRRGGHRESPDYSPANLRRDPSPRRAVHVRDRGSPDYGVGSERQGPAGDSEGTTTRSRSPPLPDHDIRARQPLSPRRRPSSPHRSGSPARRRPSPDYAMPPARGRPDTSPDGRAKRPRRASPDYSLRRSPSPQKSPLPVNPRNTAKPPLPPQGVFFQHERNPAQPPREPRSQLDRNGPSVPYHASFSRGDEAPPRGPSLASQFARMGNAKSQTWRRDLDRPTPSDHMDLRPNSNMQGDGPRGRRPSPEYGRDGPISQNPFRAERRAPPPTEATLSRLDRGESASDGLPYETDAGTPRSMKGIDLAVPAASAAPSDSAQAPERFGPPSASGQSNGAPVKFSLVPSPVKANVHLAKPGLRQFFEAVSPTSPQQSEKSKASPFIVPASTPMQPTTRTSDVDMEIDESPIHTGPVAEHLAPGEYLDEIARSEKRYTEHLDTIAPYIRSAFKEWQLQDQGAPLSAFLVHYFGRPPTPHELNAIEQLMTIRTRLSSDQDKLRDMHAKAVLHEKDTQIARDDQLPGSNVSSEAGTSAAQTPNGQPSQKPDLAMTREGEPTSRPLPGEAYERLACVGEGTYGKVYKARRAEDGTFVALKRIRMVGEKDGFPVTAMREIKLLQGLQQENIIRLHEMMVSKGSVYMVFDYMDHDLTGVLSHPDIEFSPANLKSLNYQMIAGLAYLHKIGILHRDMKGSNILLDAQGVLKIADFGLARLYNRKRKADYTNRVITLWYRSPELLMGETVYGPEVDMWSAGCIMLEMFFTKPVLQGNDEIHQLEVIFSVAGTPREDDWPQVRELPWYELVKPKNELRSKFRESFSKRLSPAAMDVAEGLLAMNPAKRLSAVKALQMPYFESEDPPMERPTQLAGIGEHHEMSAKQERKRRNAEGR